MFTYAENLYSIIAYYKNKNTRDSTCINFIMIRLVLELTGGKKSYTNTNIDITAFRNLDEDVEP